ncbi:hypothetical protein [Olivibacter sp. XZL3]|uniref:hypothetical protein n=1 Tax=Olivibacter sp. XZL3 TaxID=1735116 RepID=UPI001065FF0D|nr:hypothetical protein [Olivibacter sp. XZL3]
MDYFDVTVDNNVYVIKPALNGSELSFTTDVDNSEVLFKDNGDGITAITTNADLDLSLLEKIAKEIESYTGS